MKNRASYIWGTMERLLYIVDENKGDKTVTNDIENVLEEIRAQFKQIAMMSHFSLMGFTIIYQDSDGYWDGVILKDDKFSGFFPIRTKSFQEAVATVAPQNPYCSVLNVSKH